MKPVRDVEMSSSVIPTWELVPYTELWLHVTALFLVCPQEPGKRSQLWRMTGTGMLAHEGSSVPHNPNKPSAARSTEGSAILDIAGLAAVTDNR